MRQLRAIGVLALALTVTVTADVFAWNRSGHMVVASLAYQELSQKNPARLKELLTILKSHPSFHDLWQPILNEGLAADRDEMLFLLAARWPDDCRDQPLKSKYHRRVWHFADHALKLAGAPDEIVDGKLMPSPPEPGDQSENCANLLEALPHNLKVLSGADPDATKAIAICWILHLTGDMHQPLHMSTRYSALFPQGDRGGNSTFVIVPPSHASRNYHTFWDDIVLAGPKSDSLVQGLPDQLKDHVEEARATATNLGKLGRGRDKFPQLKAAKDFGAWAKESLDLSRKVAYLDGDLKEGTDVHNAFLMPDGFLKVATATANDQVILAGYRLADLLK